MAGPNVHLIPVVSLGAPKYARLARRIKFPPSDRARGDHFFPAFAGFNVGAGSDVDVSFLYSFTRTPNGGFDRHLQTEEMFVPLEGDLCIPLAQCKEPDNPSEKPLPDEFVCAIVPQGEAIILPPNVWHNGGWPVDGQKGVRYIMVLSGHRSGQGHQGHVDYIATQLPDGILLYPDW
jgi:hypothetical protein